MYQNPLRHMYFSICHLGDSQASTQERLSDEARRAWRVGVEQNPPISAQSAVLAISHFPRSPGLDGQSRPNAAGTLAQGERM